MGVLTKKLFWSDALERGVKTVAQTLVAVITATGALDLFTANWGDAFSVAGLAGALSILSSIGSAGSGNSASLTVDNIKNKK